MRRAVRVANARVYDDEPARGRAAGHGHDPVGGWDRVRRPPDHRAGRGLAGLRPARRRAGPGHARSIAGPGADRRGPLTPDEARTSSVASAILQALGVGPDVEASLSLIALRRGDRVLLCCDGLHEPARRSRDRRDPRHRHEREGQAADTLVAAARAAGGADNITALVAFVDGSGLSPPIDDDDLPTFRRVRSRRGRRPRAALHLVRRAPARGPDRHRRRPRAADHAGHRPAPRAAPPRDRPARRDHRRRRPGERAARRRRRAADRGGPPSSGSRRSRRSPAGGWPRADAGPDRIRTGAASLRRGSG